MQYYSTNKQAPDVTLEEAVVKGLAADKGLFMPFTIKPLPQEFYDSIDTLGFQEIAYRVADAFFGEDVPADTLKQIVYDTLSFDVPLVEVTENIYSLELFHGPTLAFKDVGGRFMARLLGYFIRKEGKKQVNVLVATSGDTGSAVANGFLGVEGIHVYVLYPKGKVSEIQEKQFTTLGQNITALEVDGTFDDCQALVKAAFMDKELNSRLQLTSANSINVARFLPQAFYYFYAYAQLKRAGKAANAGGVSVSGLEMTQNSIKLSWSQEEVDEKLKSIMKNIHAACVQYGTEPDGYINYVKGANVAGFMKVAKAMMAQGIV